MLTVGIIGTSLVDYLLDHLATRKYDKRLLPEFEGENGPILLGPFLVGEMQVLLGKLMQVADKREGHRPRRVFLVPWSRTDEKQTSQDHEKQGRKHGQPYLLPRLSNGCVTEQHNGGNRELRHTRE